MKQFFINIGLATMGRKEAIEDVPLTEKEKTDYLIFGVLMSVVFAALGLYWGIKFAV